MTPKQAAIAASRDAYNNCAELIDRAANRVMDDVLISLSGAEGADIADYTHDLAIIIRAKAKAAEARIAAFDDEMTLL